jgi:hypothetical protein
VKLTPRRAIAAAAITSAAVLLPAVALASSGSPVSPAGSAAPSTASVGRCLRSQLTAWLGFPGSQTAGSSYYPLEISNVSLHACTLYGFPGVSAVKSGGGQMGSAAGRATGYPEGLITLQPFQTVHADLQITDVYNFPPSTCHPASAVALKVYAPGDFGWMEVPFSFTACAKSGPVFMHVSPTFGNTGIPGYLND